jgi:hypothetical protein
VSIALVESFRVDAPADLVWGFLTDPAQVVRCLPGSELTETIDERTYGGRVKVKVGPISTAYAGRATLTEVDAVARRMQLTAEGKESGGAGSARMSMTGEVSDHPDGGSEVRVSATIDIAGKVMQFGRGMVESVSRQLFKQFADSVKAALEYAEVVRTTAAHAAAAAAAGEAPMPATIEIAPPPPAPTEVRMMPLIFRAFVAFLQRLFGRRGT